MTQQFFFYPHILDNLPIPESGFDVCQDMADKRLRLYVTARGIKTFFVRLRVRGKDQRIILGNYPKISIDEARAMAGPVIAKAVLPLPAKKQRVPFSRAVKVFVAEKIHRTPQSMQKLNRTINNLWAPLMNKYMNDITTGELVALNADIAENHGAATANRMREILRSLFNFAMAKNWLADNPVLAVKPVPEHRHKSKLTLPKLGAIVNKVKREKNWVLRCAFLMLIFSFMKKSHVFSMNWDDMDLKTYYYKNQPLTDSAAVLLESIPQTGKWIFPNGRGGHITDPRVSWNKIVKDAGAPGVQMNDCLKLLHAELKWSNAPETLRANMNKVLEKLA